MAYLVVAHEGLLHHRVDLVILLLCRHLAGRPCWLAWLLDRVEVSMLELGSGALWLLATYLSQ